MLKKIHLALLAPAALCLTAAASTAHAQGPMKSLAGPYLTVGAGAGYWETYDPSVTQTLQASGGGTATSDKFSAAGRVGLGYRLDQYSSFEVNYHHGGKYSAEMNIASGPVEIEMDVRRVALTYLLTVPINPSWSLTGRLGAHRWEEQFSVAGTDTGERSGTSFTFGVGASFPLSNTADLAIEYQNFQHSKDGGYQTFGEFMAGAVFRF